MKCLDCQNDLIAIPTSQGPALDVCCSGHGLWLDSGEVNFFVEDYRSLERAVSAGGGIAVRTQTLCPRCGHPMEAETVSDTSFLVCDACYGWWLPRGSLTRLNEAYRGAAVPIQIREAELFTRAAARQASCKDTFYGGPGFNKTLPDTQRVWFWALFFGLALAIAGLIFFAGIGATLRTARWNRPPDQTFVYLALAAIGAFGLIIYGWVVNKRKRLIESIPTSTIRALALGLVEISGRAQPEESLLSTPFSGFPCVFYSYAVEERVGSDKNTRWETIAKGTSEQPFYVADGTGRVLVVPLGAEVVLSEERTYRNDWLGELSPAAIAGLNRLGISAEGWIGTKTLRCRETCLFPDEQVFVLGTALEHYGESTQIENPSRLYIGSGRDHEFIISDRSEKQLLSRLWWQVSACIVGGLTLAVICLIMIFTHYLTAVS